jgi:FkbM family methyltransferase
MKFSKKLWMHYLTKSSVFGEFNEYALEALYSQVLVKGDIAIDGGANVGRHTTRMSKIVGEAGLVIAVEPIPELSDKLSGIPNTTVIRSAIGMVNGVTSFQHVPKLEGWSGLKRRPDLSEDYEVVELEISVTTLDSIIDALRGTVVFVKLDLEGGEFDALRGSRNLLKNSRPIVVFENALNHTAKLYDYSGDEFYSFFESVDYCLLDGFGGKCDRFDFDFNQPQPWQFIAFPKEKDNRRMRKIIRKSNWKAVSKINKVLYYNFKSNVLS